MDSQQDLPLYYKYTNNPYQPSESEEDFHNEIVSYASSTKASRANFAESFIMFAAEIKEDDQDAKIYLFTSLVEAIDKSKLPTQKPLLFETLDNVIALYKDDLSSTIDFYLSSDILGQNIKDYLRLMK